MNNLNVSLKTTLVLLLVLSSDFSKAQLTTMHFDVLGKNIFIKLKVNESDSLLFGFDTGSTLTFIDSLQAVRAGVKLANDGPEQVAENGGAGSYPKSVKQQIKLFGDLKIEGISLLLENYKDYKRFTGIDMNGIIGYDLLRGYVTTLDFDKQQISLFNNIKEVDTSGFVGMAFEFNKGVNIPRIPVVIQSFTNESFSGKVMFDSGAGTTLLISSPFRNYHKLGNKLGNTFGITGRGINGQTKDERGMIKSLNIGNFHFGEMIVNSSVNDQAKPADGYLGIIGMDIIKRFNVILDYPNKKLYLKPNKNYNLAFETLPAKG